MNKQSVITILFVLVSMAGRAQTMVWDEVVTGYVNQSNISVTKVALSDYRTELTLHVSLVKGAWITIAPNTVLKTDGKDFALQ